MNAQAGRVFMVNTSFAELDNLAAALSGAGLLSRYVRPYVNKGRAWERVLAAVPGAGALYGRTFGRRCLPAGLPAAAVSEAGRVADFAAAVANRALKAPRFRKLRDRIAGERISSLGRAGGKAFAGEAAVVAGWGCAEPSFRRAKRAGALCVLNYSLAHPRFVRRLLEEEAAREPEFASTLNSHDFAPWLEHRFAAEIELADRILVGSSFARDSFVAEQVPARKLSVIPYGVDTAYHAPLSPPGGRSRRGSQFRVLFVGQVGQRKGISYLLRAYERFHGAGTSLTLIGRASGAPSALAPYRALFTHHDHMPRAGLREHYRQADVFVLPTLVDGMGLVVLEAMASGLPVICTTHGPGDLVRDGIDGFMVPIRDPEAIARRLEELRADPALAAWMGRNARERALEFSWDAYRASAAERIRGWMGERE